MEWILYILPKRSVWCGDKNLAHMLAEVVVLSTREGLAWLQSATEANSATVRRSTTTVYNRGRKTNCSLSQRHIFDRTICCNRTTYAIFTEYISSSKLCVETQQPRVPSAPICQSKAVPTRDTPIDNVVIQVTILAIMLNFSEQPRN